MKIAIFSDIHANLPALEAVLKNIEKHCPDDIYCLGDLVNFAGWDNEVIELIRKRCITCVQGNHDEGIGYNKSDFSFSYSNAEQEKFGYESIGLVNKSISSDNRNYLSTLPFMLQLEFRFPFHHLKLTMVHGSVESNNEYVGTSMDETSLMGLMDAINTDILLMGHTHIPYHRSLYCEKENRKIYKHAINVGSVGKPKHGNNHACYCIVTINGQTDLSNPASVDVHFEYVSYKIDEVIKHMQDLGLSDAYNDFLLNG
jgi:putative phosphoesterase